MELDLELNLCCRTAGWICKQNDESISPASSCTYNHDLFDDNTHLHVYFQCRIGHCCTMYHEASYPLWRHNFLPCNNSIRTACTVHIPNCNHCTWGGQEILISPAAQFMQSQTRIQLSSPSLTNEEDNLQNQELFITVTLSHYLQYLNIEDVQGKRAGRKFH